MLNKRILHIRESNIYGSPERLIFGQIKNGRIFEYYPVTYRKKGKSNPFAFKASEENIKFYELNEHFTGDLSTAFRLAKLAKKLSVSLLVSHEYKSNLYGYLASKLTGLPHVIHFHGFTSEDTKVRFYNKIDISVMKRSRAIITVSDQTKERLIKNGISGEKIEVIVNAIDDEAFEKIPFGNNVIDKNIPLLVGAGRFSYEKGFDILIESLAKIKESGYKFNMLLYGDGPEKSNLTNLIDKFNLNDRIFLPGFIADLRPPFGAMEFLVIPSRSEGFPLVLLEAWAQGAPVVATPVGGLPGLIENNINGLLTKDDSPESLAGTIIEALNQNDFKSRCGENGKKLTKDKYNFNVQLESLEKIYKSRIE